MRAEDIIRALELKPHPEGGHYRETFRDDPAAGPLARSARGGPVAPDRAHSTAIYFLLKASEVSRWHRIDAAEVWHYYAGAPLELRIANGPPLVLGTDLAAGQRPQIVVPPGAWQTARSLGDCSLGDFTLVGCTVAPGFDFAAFELAPDGFAPG